MYFSRQRIKMLKQMIQDGKYQAYEVKLNIGCIKEESLSDFIDTMFVAWRRIVSSRSRGYIRNFDGILRRLFIEYNAMTGLYTPYFHLICVKKKQFVAESEKYKTQLDEEILRISTYIKWLSAWVTALKFCAEAPVDFSILDIECLEKTLSVFCTNEKYSVRAILDEARKEILKRACGTHRLVSFHGIFSEKYMNRHVSVER